MQIEDIGNEIINISFEGKKVEIFFLNGDSIKILNDTYSHFYLYKGKKMSHEEIDEIGEYDQIAHAKQYAINLLNKGLYSEFEIKQKLKGRKIKEKAINEALEILKSLNIISDENYTKEIISLYNKKCYGRKRIIEKLNNAKISSSIINILEFDEDEERKKALYQFNKYFETNKNKSFEKRKQGGFSHLLTLGFDSNICNEVINTSYNFENIDEEILDPQIRKYVLSHHIDLKNYDERQKVVNTFYRKGFSYDLIKKILGGIEDE